MSLLSAAERLAAMDRSQVIFNVDRCLHTRDKFSECAACYEICPVDAIVPGKPPTLDAEKCETCLACLPACPIGAYSADDDVTALLKAASMLEPGTLEIVCGQNSNPELGQTGSNAALRIHQCLAGLGTGAYTELAAFGFEQILLRCEDCQECKWSVLKSQIEKQTKHANNFLAAWNKDRFVEIVDVLGEGKERPIWDASTPPVSRRELFRMIANKSQTMMARAMENISSGTERRPGRDRLRLTGAVAHLPAREAQTTVDLEGFGFAAVDISEACTACAACARACPTEALTFDKKPGEEHFKLEFSASKCIDCGICVHVCGVSAVELNVVSTLAGIFTNETVTLAEGNLIKCADCGVFIAERQDVKRCPVCEFRSQHPFGSSLPKVVQMALDARAKGKIQ